MDLRHGLSDRHCPGGADHISFLSDDMILLILARLHCVRTAVRTGLLSRRWRGLWTGLTDLAFRGVPPANIEAAFSHFNAGSSAGTAFQLDIRLPSRTGAIDANSLLRAVALFSPARLVFTIAPGSRDRGLTEILLPCFQHATSIELDMQQFTVKPPAAGEFSALERLSISGAIVHIGAWVTRCPRLGVLRAKLRGLESRSLRLELGSLKAALSSREVALFLDISIPRRDASLLSEVACLSPRELVYTNSEQTYHWAYTGDLPCFNRATSIEIDMPGTSFTPPLHGELSALERLCLFRCNIDNIGKFISCCPRLRVLRVDKAMSMSERDITVHSTSLQELVLGTYKDCRSINIVAPELKQLTMEVLGAGRDVGTSVLAPLLEKVSWRHSYTLRTPPVLGCWLLESLSLQMATSNNGEQVLTDDEEDDTWLSVQQLPDRAHVLSIAMCAFDTFKQDPSSANLNLAREINKFAVTEFSVVYIRLHAMGHVYGATMFHLLQALPVHSATKVLKVNLMGPETSEDPDWSETPSEVTRACKKNCFCEESKNWRRQRISLHYLEEVEIKGFTGESHGFDFLKLIFRCAPNLQKVTIKLARRTKSFNPGGCAKKIYRISLAYPYVVFYVHLVSGRLVPDP